VKVRATASALATTTQTLTAKLKTMAPAELDLAIEGAHHAGRATAVRVTTKVLRSIPFAVIASLALIFTTIGLTAGSGLPFGVVAAAQGGAMFLGIVYSGMTIRHRRQKDR